MTASVDVFVAGWNTTGVIQGDPGGHQCDGHGVDANVDPALVGDAKVEIESQAQQQAPSGHGSLATSDARVVQGGPGVVDDEAREPFFDRFSLVDLVDAQGDDADAPCHEHGVTEGFEMETVLGFPEGCVGGLKREQAAPRYVVGGVNHPEHVQEGQGQAPEAHAHHDGRIDGRVCSAGLAGRIVAHGPCDLRTAFKHTEPGVGRFVSPIHNEVWWW